MIEINNLEHCEDSLIAYGGHSGSKKGIIIDNERYLVKFPKSTKSMDVEGLTYTTTPICEYLGSHIYQTLGIETHQTILGKTNEKIVVACKDFLSDTEKIIDFNAIRNNYDEDFENYLEERHSSDFDRKNDLDDVIFIMENNKYFVNNKELKNRFWDMFIIDALINNNDRNEGNWGLIIDTKTKNIRISPVYDNGASFYGKSSDEKLFGIYLDDFKFNQVALESAISIFTSKGRMINPLKYISSMENDDCNKALARIIPKINLVEIKKIFDEVPEKFEDLAVFSKAQRLLFFKVLEFRYNYLKNVYDKLGD